MTNGGRVDRLVKFQGSYARAIPFASLEWFERCILEQPYQPI